MALCPWLHLNLTGISHSEDLQMFLLLFSLNMFSPVQSWHWKRWRMPSFFLCVFCFSLSYSLLRPLMFNSFRSLFDPGHQGEESYWFRVCLLTIEAKSFSGWMFESLTGWQTKLCFVAVFSCSFRSLWIFSSCSFSQPYISHVVFTSCHMARTRHLRNLIQTKLHEYCFLHCQYECVYNECVGGHVQDLFLD